MDEGSADPDGGGSALKLIVSVGLVVLSGLFSGLTLGLMSLDMVGLEIVAKSGNERDAQNARKIAPVRKKGNLLLCTLLLGNVLVNSSLSVFIADFTNGAIGILVSTAIIVIFGEIMPQAVCSRHGLAIGAATIGIVKVFLYALWIIAYPISLVLDRLLGGEIGTIYSKRELEYLVKIHTKSKHSDLRGEEGSIIEGALKLAEKTAESIMTPAESVFMLEERTLLDFDMLSQIVQSGHSRIPVYRENRNNIIGLLFTKDLVLLDPDDRVSIDAMLTATKAMSKLVKVWHDTPLNVILNEFKRGRSHLATVWNIEDPGVADPFYSFAGIVTLEDIIEEIIQSEIVDETDVYIDTRDRTPVPAAWGHKRERSSSVLRLFQRRGPGESITEDERDVVATILSKRCPSVFGENVMPEDLLHSLIENATVRDIDEEGETIIERGKSLPVGIVTLRGKLTIRATSEGFESEHGPWSTIGCDSLVELSDTPVDYTAVVSEAPCRLVEIAREQYSGMLELRNKRRMRLSSTGSRPDIAQDEVSLLS